MPDKDKSDQQGDVQPAPAPAAPAERVPTRTEQEQQAISRVALEAAAKHLDETVSGGRYLQDGVYVDANGVPLKDQS